ncbi:MAG: thiol-disulfide oxidoreductase DCC family protein [Sediminibacterium sp.]|uniref:thiol-disulfide oxidoreductase DCC family protein n=1 Tax=Sediminibacterium sp. TaxID=1917865 RepID=UPI0027246F86|nr:thiol-disulfide oxidoreductase DCC family protein [Sediminibacterium sp.]MDO8996647.1 thiol-disulfide oxidoreductase DCC family protein [Sediminibacterium sp.]
MEITSNTNPVILFDGVCNLCNSSVQFVIKHDPKKKFRFASIQGDYGQQVLKQFHLPPDSLNSFILLKDNQIYTHSTGALKVAKQLSGAWPLLYVFIIIPPFIRNAVYQFIANNRYKWFGKKESCAIPSPELKALFYN